MPIMSTAAAVTTTVVAAAAVVIATMGYFWDLQVIHVFH